jgi:RNA polymerase sigma-70 factor (ECF subfamily)
MNTRSVFDELLVLQYQSGDQKALDLLVKRYHAKLCRHAFWYTKDLDGAKDVVQESWRVIVNKMDGLRDPRAFESWVMSIVTRSVRSF